MAGTEFRRYLEAIRDHPSFEKRRQSYVPTDLLDRQQTNRQPIEQPDFFAEFAAFDLDLNVQTAEEEQPEGLGLEQSEKIERLPVLAGIRKYAADHVLLVGKPGSGKSTALERLLVQEAELALGNVQAPIPVLLKLRDLRTSVWDLLQLSLVSRDPNLETVDLAALLTSGQLLLLWDGVNELPTGLDELKELRQRYRQTPMIFTTRTLSAGSNLGIEKKLEMQPLTEPQMRQFTCNYLGKEKGDRLIQQLGQRLREFGETPLLLWMLCGIYGKAGQIPSNLGSVFRLFVSIYDFSFDATVFLEIYSCDFIEGLIQLLDHDDSDTRTTAAEILAAIDSMKISRWLPKILNHQDCRMWQHAADALKRMPPEQAIDGWICILSNQTNPRVSKSRCLLVPSAAHVLRDIGTPEELAQLWKLYRFGNEEVLDAIFAIQERCRFYNYEIEQMDLPVALESAYSIVNQYTFPSAQEVKIIEKVDTYHDRSTNT